MFNRYLIVGIISCLSCAAYAEIYHYVDESGKKVYVDRLSKVPLKYRNQLDKRRSPYPLDAKKSLLRDIQGLRVDQDQSKRELQDAMVLYETPLRTVAGMPVISAKVVNGSSSRTLSLQLNKQSSFSLLNTAAAASLSSATPKWGVVTTEKGHQLKAYKLNVDKMSFGPYNYDYRTFVVVNPADMTLGVDGVLGKRFLANMKFSTDLVEGKLIWEPEHYQQLQTKLADLDLLIEKQKQVQQEVENTDSLEGREVKLIPEASVEDIQPETADADKGQK